MPSSPDSTSVEEEQASAVIMNNYFGIGVDAMLSLDFHLAREEQPNKFNSRLELSNSSCISSFIFSERNYVFVLFPL